MRHASLTPGNLLPLGRRRVSAWVGVPVVLACGALGYVLGTRSPPAPVAPHQHAEEQAADMRPTVEPMATPASPAQDNASESLAVRHDAPELTGSAAWAPAKSGDTGPEPQQPVPPRPASLPGVPPGADPPRTAASQTVREKAERQGRKGIRHRHKARIARSRPRPAYQRQEQASPAAGIVRGILQPPIQVVRRLLPPF
jgi:hypothetical protein